MPVQYYVPIDFFLSPDDWPSGVLSLPGAALPEGVAFEDLDVEYD